MQEVGQIGPICPCKRLKVGQVKTRGGSSQVRIPGPQMRGTGGTLVVGTITGTGGTLVVGTITGTGGTLSVVWNDRDRSHPPPICPCKRLKVGQVKTRGDLLR
jgi:hypothetical protein